MSVHLGKCSLVQLSSVNLGKAETQFSTEAVILIRLGWFWFR